MVLLKEWGCLHGLTGSTVGPRSQTPEFKSLYVGMPEGCFIFQFAILSLEVVHLAHLVPRNGHKNIKYPNIY